LQLNLGCVGAVLESSVIQNTAETKNIFYEVNNCVDWNKAKYHTIFVGREKLG
jgi:hypothetical protein